MGLSGDSKSDTNRVDAIHKRDIPPPRLHASFLCTCLWLCSRNSSKKYSLKPSIFPGKWNENYWTEWIALREHTFSCTHALKSNRGKKRQQIYLILIFLKTIKIECSVIIKMSFQVTDCETKASSNVVIYSAALIFNKSVWWLLIICYLAPASPSVCLVLRCAALYLLLNVHFLSFKSNSVKF